MASETTTGFELINTKVNARLQELVIKINNQSNDSREFNELASLLSPKLKFFIWKFFHKPEPTDEVLQETLFKIFKNIHTYDAEKGRFTTWVYNIARNEALLHSYHMKKIEFIDFDSVMYKVDKADSEFGVVEQNQLQFYELYNMTMNEITNMPECIEKSILIDQEVNKMKGKEISEKYEMNLSTVKTKLRKARKMVRERLLEKDPSMSNKIKDSL